MDTWKHILICFSIVALSCAVKNYMIYQWHNTPFFFFISPSFFGEHNLYVTPELIKKIYNFQYGVKDIIKSFFIDGGFYKTDAVMILLTAPLVEEFFYRGPLFILKDKVRPYIWWGLAVVLSAIFAHSHSLYGLSLLPIFTLGICCSWLIKASGSFWSCLMLHFLFNLYTYSYYLYQSLFGAD